MNPIKTIYKKELMDLLRDKRARTSAIFAPMMLVIFMLCMVGYLQDTVSKPKNQSITFVTHPTPSAFESGLKKALGTAGFTIKEVPNDEVAKQKILSGDAGIVLDVPTSVTQPPIKVNEFYDPTNDSTSIVRAGLAQVVEEANKSSLAIVLQQHGINPAVASPIVLVDQKVQKSASTASEFLVGLLPYLIVIWAFYGGMGSVGDMVAGEKEKNTLETLLTAPVSRTQLALGKLLALSTLCFASALSSVIGVVLAGIATRLFGIKMLASVFAQGFGVSPVGFITVVVLLAPAVFMFAGALLAVSTIARNVREAYTQLTPLSFVVLIPAIFSQFISFTSFGRSSFVGLIPVLNTAVGMRDVMSGHTDFVLFGLSFLVNGCIAAALLFNTVRLFNREDVLLRM